MSEFGAGVINSLAGYPNARDCEHGHLRRKCPECETEREIADLTEALRRANAEIEGYRKTQAEIMRTNSELRRRLAARDVEHRGATLSVDGESQ